jgi:hypothetical protein
MTTTIPRITGYRSCGGECPDCLSDLTVMEKAG